MERPMSDLLLQNAMVLQIDPDGTRANILREHDVLISGSRIEAVLPTGQIDPSQAREVIDATDRLVMPGLINTHAHVPMVIFRGLAEDVTIDKWFNDYIWPLESNLQAEDVYWGMQLGLAEMIEAGVTSVADHYFYMDEAAQAVEKAGTRGLLAWAIFGSQGAGMIERTGEFVRRWQGAAEGRIRTWLAPHAPYTCDDDFLRASAKAAAALGVGIHIHASENMDQTRASIAKHGKTPLQVLADVGVLDVPTILAHVCGALPQDIELLSKYTTGIAHAPKTYLKLAMDIAPVAAFRAAGIPVGLASDGAVSNNTLNIWESLRLMALMAKDRAETPEAMPIAEALHVATRGSARVFGLPDDLGAVEPGYLADVIIVDLGGVHHQPLHSVTASLVYNVQPADVQTVIINGRVVMRDRQLLTLDKAEIIAQVRAGMARLAQRQPDKRIQSYNP
jgi:5-methylthioadenosine/S-adenosylhomocysteine deaminase